MHTCRTVPSLLVNQFPHRQQCRVGKAGVVCGGNVWRSLDMCDLGRYTMVSSLPTPSDRD